MFRNCHAALYAQREIKRDRHQISQSVRWGPNVQDGKMVHWERGTKVSPTKICLTSASTRFRKVKKPLKCKNIELELHCSDDFYQRNYWDIPETD